VEDPSGAYGARLSARIGKHGQPECFAFTLTLHDGSRLDWQRLRKVPLENWLSVGMTQLLEEHDDATGHWIAPGLLSPSALRDRLLKRAALSARLVIDGPSSRRPLTPEFLEEVAAVYKGAKATGAKPIVALEQEFPGYSRAAINKWVRRARELGLIEPAKYARRTTKGGK
jgi:hypothetical protein